MVKTYFLCLWVLLALFSGCVGNDEPSFTPVLIPQPRSVVFGGEHFRFTPGTTVHAQAPLNNAAGYLNALIESGTGFPLRYPDKDGADIRFVLKETLPAEGYELNVSGDGVLISAADGAGAFYAVQTIRQLLNPELEAGSASGSIEASIQAVRIQDHPQFPYRGMHLDVGRHFFPVSFIKEYISWLAMLKMNKFHWHLTEDQGWRLEIDKYPRLTSHGAWRDSTLMGHYFDFPRRYKQERYGGYYSKEDIREVVAFADSLHVTIIPEIEMPGHAQAAISAYPELGCTGEKVPVASEWGIFDQVYCPNENTFTFLTDVLDEVMELFPGEYIHIGGDEAPKKNWKQCDHCQALIAKNDLVDEEGLQSWFIKRIESHVNSKGRRIIGWDEILEGGLAPNATVMSWRGMEGGIEAAKSGHDVIMTPTSHAYFDYYQSDHPDEPLAIGGYLPLRKVYGFNPVPRDLNPEKTQHILGGQGNVWTEYMPTTEQVEYMVFPRILAMAQVLWKGPVKNPDSSFAYFAGQVANFEKRLKHLDIKANNTALYEVKSEVVKSDQKVQLALSTLLPGLAVRYSVNNGRELKYSTPIALDSSAVVRSYAVENGRQKGRVTIDSIAVHKGIRAVIAVNKDPHPLFDDGGLEALNNGRLGSGNRFRDSEWLGFWGEDLDIDISLKDLEKANSIRTRFYHSPGQWVYAPERAILSAQLSSGSVYSTTTSIQPSQSGPVNCSFDMSSIRLEFGDSIKIDKVRISIPNYGVIAEGRQGAGNSAWTFIDEIVVE